jgi:hypothetical protein
MTTNYADASNAIVSTVGFYAGALAEATTAAETATKRQRELEKQVALLAEANAKLSREEQAARGVAAVAGVYVAMIEPCGTPETKMDVALQNLMDAVKAYDAGA